MSGNVLLVDDSEAFLLTGGLALSRAGYRFKTANNGKRALDLLTDGLKAGKPFDLVVLDIMMPVMGGLELLEEIQRREIKVPVLMITGLSDEKTKQNLLERGCADYLCKPFPLAEFIERVDAVVRKRQERREHPLSQVH